MSKELATAIRDVDLGEIDLDHIAAREPDRSRLRETFREFELRAPLERLEEALGEGEAAAPAERAEEVIHTKARTVPLAEIGALEGELVALAAERPRPAGEPDGQETLDVGGPPLGPMEVAAYAGGEVLVAECETLTALDDGARRAAGRLPRLEDHGGERGGRARRGARARHDDRRVPDRPGAARLSARRAHRRGGHRGRGGGRERRRRASGGHARPGRAPTGASRGGRPHAALPRGGAAAGGRAGGDGARRRSSWTWSGCGASRSASASARAELEQRVWELAGEEFTIGSPQQLGADPVREARAVAQAARQDGLLHRRPGAPGDPLRARDHPGDRGVAGGHEAEVDLPGRVPRADRRRRPPPHDLQPDRHGHRPAVEHRPEPPEHPDPHRAGTRDPRLLRGRGRPQAHLRRLLAGGAAPARAHRRRAGAEGHLPPRRGRAHRHRRGDPRREVGSRHALEGEDGQLRDRLRAVRVRTRRPAPDREGGGAGVHRRLPRALPEGEGVHRAHDRARARGGPRRNAVRPDPARARSCALASSRRARWASGWP